MSPTSLITLQNLQDYARKYFPDELAKLPSSESMTWARASPYRSSTQVHINIASKKLFIGYNKNSGRKYWMLHSLDFQSELYTIREGQKSLRRLQPKCLVFSHWQYVNPVPQLQHALRCDETGPFLSAFSGDELGTLCHCYFMAKGLFPTLRPEKVPSMNSNGL
jgi:hypothetical protein